MWAMRQRCVTGKKDGGGGQNRRQAAGRGKRREACIAWAVRSADRDRIRGWIRLRYEQLSHVILARGSGTWSEWGMMGGRGPQVRYRYLLSTARRYRVGEAEVPSLRQRLCLGTTCNGQCGCRHEPRTKVEVVTRVLHALARLRWSPSPLDRPHYVQVCCTVR